MLARSIYALIVAGLAALAAPVPSAAAESPWNWGRVGGIGHNTLYNL